ncbi:MAG: hypothetical protein SVY53_12760 [Chloroflexota bacterium]|nr:hypothetical protein [Chloroflexota bacterium]
MIVFDYVASMTSAARTLVTFKNSSFNTTDDREYFINPCNYGEDVAFWIADGLEQFGATVSRKREFPAQEDFGWFVNFRIANQSYCLVVGARSEDENDYEWVVWLERDCGILATLLGGRRRHIEQDAVELVHRVITSSPTTADIRWYNWKDYDSGKEDLASDRP